MKKVKIQKKLSLDKMTVAKLNDEQNKEIKGGGFLSIGKRCTVSKCVSKLTRGIWCNEY